ncbi:MAG: DUF427 domain-containing protein [Actinomycetota bacterium]
MNPEDVTLVRNAIHNPADPRHFMRVVPAEGERTASVGSTTIARSGGAVVVKEVGRDVYDHVVYFPRADVDMDALTAIDKTTHCPLKGDTEYFDLTVGGERVGEAAWSYRETIEVAAELNGLVAFDTSKVTVT